MWYAVIDAVTGQLLSTGTVLADPLPEGLTAVEVGAQVPAGEWNPLTRVFDASTVRASIEPIDFLRRFTFAKEVAIRTAAKTNVGIEVFLARLAAAKSVNLDHVDTVSGVQYLVSLGLITAEEGAEVLA